METIVGTLKEVLELRIVHSLFLIFLVISFLTNQKESSRKKRSKKMGNSAGSSVSRRRYQGHHPQPPARPTQPPTPSSQPEITGNQYVIAVSTAYPSQFPNANLPQYNPYPSYHPAAPSTISYHRDPRGRYPGAMAPHLVNQNVEHQKAVTIRNDVNIKKETVRLEPDEENPGKFLVAFTFDANVAGSITVIFFAKEGVDCDLVATREDLFKPVSVTFQQGLGQKFRQPSGTGIDFSMLENTELVEGGIDMGIYPLVVKAKAYTTNQSESEENSKANFTKNSQNTLAVFENREKGDYQVRVMKQILWVNGMRYELQEIYGIGNAVDDEQDENDDPGKECVVCLSEPRDTTVLPCRHMCLCSGCAKVLCFQTNRCPICRQPVERLLEIKVNNGTDD